MIIGVIGAGNVGSTLGRGLTNAGHSVVYGVRAPSDEAPPPLVHDRAQVASVREAVAASEVVLLTTPWNATESALAAAGDFGGKVLLDATNPIGPGFALTHGHTDSGGEQVQRWAKTARVVKVFNTTGRENMENPRYPSQATAMFVCGDDDAARSIALGLARDLGFDAVDAGKLDQARLLEPAALLWIRLALVQGLGRDMAFGLLRR